MKTSLIRSTPIQTHSINGRAIFVKREDLCIDDVSFSKVRGILPYLQKDSAQTVAVLDSRHSKAGWGTAIICRHLNKKCIVFYPVYKGETELRKNQRAAAAYGAELRPLPAAASYIMMPAAKKIMLAEYNDHVFLPNGLKTRETIDHTAVEAMKLDDIFYHNCTWVISVSTATIATGVLLGITKHGYHNIRVILHKGYSGKSEKNMMDYINRNLPVHSIKIVVIDEGYEYRDSVDHPSPFPCNPYYDLKAWKWLCSNIKHIKGTVLFWNIGA